MIFDSFLVIKTVLRFSLHAPSACGGRNSAKLGTITGERPNLPNDGRYKLQNLAESCTKPHPLLKASFRNLRHLSSDSRSQGSTQDSNSLKRKSPIQGKTSIRLARPKKRRSKGIASQGPWFFASFYKWSLLNSKEFVSSGCAIGFIKKKWSAIHIH